MARVSPQAAAAAVEQHGGQHSAAAALGVSRKAIRWALGKLERDVLPDKHEPVTELVERRKQQFARYDAALAARRLIPVRVRESGPIGILHFGDPHVDDDGTDIAALERHAALVRNTPGLYGANIGDVTNNWVGRLQRLYGEQSTSAVEAWRLAEWFMGQVEWLYVVGGNHDAWSGAGDPLRYIMQSQGGPFEYDGCRLSLQFPNGREVRVNARHDFKGHSQWNTAHGVSKAAQMGWRDHILVCGHKHVSGYAMNVHPDPTTGIDQGLVSHAIRIASYKRHDRYARELGLPDQSMGPCCVTIIDPAATSELTLVTVMWDPEHAADYLTWMRNRG